MNYSIENIFKNYGQFDKVVTLSFVPNSYSAKTFGQFLTGIFLYTRDERIQLEEIIKEEDHQNTRGRVRIKELLNDVCEEQKEILLKEGLNTDEIIEVFSLNLSQPKNQFSNTETKKLPEPIIIETDFKDTEYDPVALGMYNSKIRNGYSLTPYEECENIGIRLSREYNSISEIKNEKYIDPETEEVFTCFQLHFLRSRKRNDTITPEEDKLLSALEFEYLNQRIIQFRKELLKYVSKDDLATEENKAIISNIAPKIIDFHTKRLTHTKHSIWIDLDRYLHVYLRHVKEVQIGDQNKNKSTFDYDFNEIDRLIDTVLDDLKDDVQSHFDKNPDKPFKRHGKMAHYFNGNYYVIDIEPSGRLMTFYRVKE